MKKMSVLNLCLCAVMIALHIVLEVFCSIRFGNELKITFSSLPIILMGMLVGPVEGLITGFIGSFLSQLLTFGFNWTNFIWILPYALEGLSAGLLLGILKGKVQKEPIYVSVTTIVSGFVLVIFNLLASYLDGVVIYRYYTIEAIWTLIPMRLLVWAIKSIVYCAVLIPLYQVLRKLFLLKK